MGLSTNNTSTSVEQKAATREQCLEQIARLSDETLRIIAELSQRPGVEQKLKDKYPMIKLFL